MEEMKEANWTITTSYGTLEAVSIISSITGRQCVVGSGKAEWSDDEYISVDFRKMPGDILFDLDSPEKDEDIINRIIDELNNFDIVFKLKFHDVVYDSDMCGEEITCIEDFLKQSKFATKDIA
jgi:hypothetical protein